MNDQEQGNGILEYLLDNLELPDAAYEEAVKRYEDLGEWLGREDSSIEVNDPHVFSQGSIRLGTAITPVDGADSYDLDLACKLREGISPRSVTQEQLKNIVGKELENYRRARGIQSPLEPKHRCWTLEYQGNIGFHMDIVPCIPAESHESELILSKMLESGQEEGISKIASSEAVLITDDRAQDYRAISPRWHISNPAGYASWFDNRMKLMERGVLLEKAEVEEVPRYVRKTPLQRSIQILKRHRDIMFKNAQDSKPISIIITTLAAHAYRGESDLYSALETILKNLDKYVAGDFPKVPNPVNPDEDFADKWAMKNYAHLQLEKNFRAWLTFSQFPLTA